MSGQNELITRFARDLVYYLKVNPNVDLESIDHATPEQDYDLGTAHDNKKIHDRSGDKIFVTSLTGAAYIRTRLRGAKYKLRIGSISLPFKELFLTNTAQAGKSISLIIGYGAFVDFAVSYLTFKILNVAEVEINPATEEKQDTTIAQLDIKLSALRDAICDSAAPKDLKDLYDQLYNMRGAGTPKDLKQIWDVLTTIAGLDFASETTLATIAGLDFATQTTLALIKAKTDNLDVALSLIKAKTDNIDVALSTRAKEAGGNLATIAGKDFATQTTLALIKAKTDLLASIDFSTETTLATIAGLDFAEQTTLALIGGNIAAIEAKDFAEQTTLALIKAKTDNLNLTITSLRDTIAGAVPKSLKALWDELVLIKAKTDLIYNLPKEAGNFPNTYNVVITLANQEYGQTIPANTRQLTFFIRGGGVAYRYAWVTGKVATPTAPYTEVPANGIVFLDKLNWAGKTLYFACATTAKIMQIEALT